MKSLLKAIMTMGAIFAIAIPFGYYADNWIAVDPIQHIPISDLLIESHALYKLDLHNICTFDYIRVLFRCFLDLLP